MPEPLERRIRAAATCFDVPRDVVEKDYAIGHMLAATYEHPVLKERLVFKGGTALRKAYFPDYRFSEDLDFSALPGGEDLQPLIVEAANGAEATLLTQGAFDVSVTRYPTRDPHPQGQEAFRVHVRFPWQPRALCSLKLEITTDEPVLTGRRVSVEWLPPFPTSMAALRTSGRRSGRSSRPCRHDRPRARSMAAHTALPCESNSPSTFGAPEAMPLTGATSARV